MKRHNFPILLIATISIAIYANTLKNGFVFDDEATIVNNTLIKNLNNLPKLFEKKEYFARSGELSYRPVVTFTYFLDYSLHGLKPWGYHLTNLLLHTINGVLIYLFLTLMQKHSERHYPTLQGKSNKIPTIITNLPLLLSLLFVTHPVLTETVNAISFREDLLVLLFYMSTLNIYLKIRVATDNKYLTSIWYFFSCLLYIFSLLSKEMAISLPLIVFCYEWIYADKKNKISPLMINPYLLGYISIAFFYSYLRFFYFYNLRESPIQPWSITGRLLTEPWLILDYIKLTLLPVSLSSDYRLVQVSALSFPSFFLPIALTCIVFILFVGKFNKGITFGTLFFVIALMPVYNIIPLSHPFAERYLYLPTVGFILVLGEIIYNVFQSRHLNLKAQYLCAIISIAIMFFSFSSLVIKRNRIWENEYSLWLDIIKKQPNNDMAHTLLGFAYCQKGLEDKAMQEYKIALKLNPVNAHAYNNIGFLYYKAGLMTEAIDAYKMAIKLNPKEPHFHCNLGYAYVQIARFEEAIEEYELALKLKPDFYDAKIKLGIANYLKQNKVE